MGPTVKGTIYCKGQAENKCAKKAGATARGPLVVTILLRPERGACGPDFTLREQRVEASQPLKEQSESS
jgi:hypothetical protein